MEYPPRRRIAENLARRLLHTNPQVKIMVRTSRYGHELPDANIHATVVIGHVDKMFTLQMKQGG
jgi:hypothetical protein